MRFFGMTALKSPASPTIHSQEMSRSSDRRTSLAVMVVLLKSFFAKKIWVFGSTVRPLYLLGDIFYTGALRQF